MCTVEVPAAAVDLRAARPVGLAGKKCRCIMCAEGLLSSDRQLPKCASPNEPRCAFLHARLVLIWCHSEPCLCCSDVVTVSL
jgi:hypothetical protein